MTLRRGGVAQVVEQRTHKPRAGGSKPATATSFSTTPVILSEAKNLRRSEPSTPTPHQLLQQNTLPGGRVAPDP